LLFVFVHFQIKSNPKKKLQHLCALSPLGDRSTDLLSASPSLLPSNGVATAMRVKTEVVEGTKKEEGSKEQVKLDQMNQMNQLHKVRRTYFIDD
jgi:hypothetical protein